MHRFDQSPSQNVHPSSTTTSLNTKDRITDQDKPQIIDSQVQKMKPTAALQPIKNNSEDPSTHQFKVLRTLPDYTVGSPLRPQDMIICHSKEATAFAMNKLRPNDCAFILRSDGSFSYALYEGYANGDPDALSFQVDERGHFKVLPRKQFLTRVKVPVIPVALIGKVPALDKYLVEVAGNGMAVMGDGAPTGQKSSMGGEESKRSAGQLDKGKHRLARRNSGRPTPSVPQAAKTIRRTSSSNVMDTMRLAKAAKEESTKAVMMGGIHSGGGGLNRATSSVQLGQHNQNHQAKNQPRSNNIVNGMTLSRPSPQAANQSIGPNNILSQMATSATSNDNNINNSTGNLRNAKSQMAQMATATNNIKIRVASMQNFRSKMTQLGAVPESSKPRMNAPNQNSAFHLARNTTNAAVPSMMMSAGVGQGGSGSFGLRSASVGQFSNQPNTSSAAGIMPRNVTLLSIGEQGSHLEGSGNSGNASWEIATPALQGRMKANNNPLLAVNSANGSGTPSGTPMSENPLLKAMENHRKLFAATQPGARAPTKEQGSVMTKSTIANCHPTSSNDTSIASGSSTFSIGDRIYDADMPPTTMEEMKMARRVSKLNLNDYAWVKRSDKSWCYALVVNNKNPLLRIFQVTAKGDTKTLDLLNAGNYVRVIDKWEERAMIEGVAKFKMGGGGAAVLSMQQRATIGGGTTKLGNAQRRGSGGIMSGTRVAVPSISDGTSNTNHHHDLGVLVDNTANAELRLATGKNGASNKSTIQSRQATMQPIPTPMTKAAVSSAKPPIPSSNTPPSPTNTDDVTLIEFKTEEGARKTVPKYRKGLFLNYKGQHEGNDVWSLVEIIKVHLDDLLEPYYDILFEDGREKQTDNAHLELVVP